MNKKTDVLLVRLFARETKTFRRMTEVERRMRYLKVCTVICYLFSSISKSRINITFVLNSEYQFYHEFPEWIFFSTFEVEKGRILCVSHKVYKNKFSLRNMEKVSSE